MINLEEIHLDLDAFTIKLHFKRNQNTLLLSFDTPSRKFYFSLISFLCIEMKNADDVKFVYIRKFEKELRELDKLFAEKHASNSIKGMWDKIRKAWRYKLPDLETGEYFAVLNREKLSPYEKGGKYKYNCSDDECDIWANLFQYDESNTWRLKFAIDDVSLGLDGIRLSLGDLKDRAAWEEFLKRKRKKSLPIVGTAKNKGKHPRSSKLHRQLVFMVICLSLLLAISVFIFDILKRPFSSPPHIKISDKPSIAILPFVNIGGDPDNEYFCDGITDEVISKLAKLKDLRVISRTSAFSLKKSGLDTRSIGQKLDVDNILEGSVRIEKNKLRITAQLIRVNDDSHLWSESYDRELKNVFGLQETLAYEIACTLKSQLGCNDDKSISRLSTVNLEAYNLYLKGRFFFYKNSYQEAIDNFQKALEINPKFADAYAGLADAYWLVAFFHHEQGVPYYQKAMSAVLKALEIDDELSDAYVALARIKLLSEWDWKGAEEAILHAIDLEPGSAEAHMSYDTYLRIMGRFDEANIESEIALNLDPLSLLANNRRGLSLFVNNKLESAIKQLETTLAMSPEDVLTLLYLGDAYLLQNRIDEGIALMERAFMLYRDKIQFVYGPVGHAHGKVGDYEKAHKILEEALEAWKTSYFSPLAIALIYKGLGKIDETFEWLEKARVKRDPGIIHIKAFPQFRDLHSDSRFQALLKKMDLEV